MNQLEENEFENMIMKLENDCLLKLTAMEDSVENYKHHFRLDKISSIFIEKK